MSADVIARGLALGRTRGTLPIDSGAPWYFAATGLDANQSASLYTPSASQQFGASADVFWSPDYPTIGWRFYFCNWMLRGSTTLTQELDGNAAIILQGAVLVVNGVRYPLTFAGQAGITLNPGDGVWSDPIGDALLIPPRTKGSVITCWQAQTSASAMMGSFFPNAGLGEGFVLGSTTQAAYLTSGTVPYTAPASLYAYGPTAAVAQGGDGREVVLLVGDSIATGTGEANFASDARNNRGWTARWLDSTANGAQRIPHAKLCVPSGACRQNTLASHFTRRAAMMVALPNLPFTRIVNQMGLNDATGSATTWRDRITVHAGLMKALWNVPLLQLGFTPYTTADTSRFTTAAGQSYFANHDWPSGFTQQAQALLAALPTNIDRFLFIGDVFDGRQSLGAAAEGKWRSDFSAINTTLSAATLANATSIVVRGPVALGTALAINAGNATAEVVTVTAVSGVGAVTCTVFPALVNAHSAGETVRGVAVQDGLHPSTEMAAWAAERLAPRKAEVLVR